MTKTKFYLVRHYIRTLARDHDARTANRMINTFILTDPDIEKKLISYFTEYAYNVINK